MKSLKSSITSFFNEPLTVYTIIISLLISVLIVAEVIYPRIAVWFAEAGLPFFKDQFPEFVTADDKLFAQNYIEWFGMLYGILISLALIRAIEGFDKINQEFETESANVKALHEIILLIDEKHFLSFKRNMMCKLHVYCRHTLKRYGLEDRSENAYIKRHGDNILKAMRTDYNNLICQLGEKKSKKFEVVKTEFLGYLNKIIERRENRFALLQQVSFNDLRLLVIASTLLWLIPFYFLNYETGIFGSFLKLGVTFVIIMMLLNFDKIMIQG